MTVEQDLAESIYNSYKHIQALSETIHQKDILAQVDRGEVDRVKVEFAGALVRHQNLIEMFARVLKGS